MPSTFVLVALVIPVVVTVAYGYRTLTALLVLRSLPSDTSSTKLPVSDSESVALTGELVVKEPVETAAAAVGTTDLSVGAYLWRARFSNNTNSSLTIEDWGWERQRWHTFESGIEWGRFGIAVDGQLVSIDPTWLREATETKPLERLEIGGITRSNRFSVYLWDSWYTHLQTQLEQRSLRHFAGHVQRQNDDVDLDRYLLETRPLAEGMTVSVSGVLRVKQGNRVICGTDDVPLLLSDAGFDGYRRWLRGRALRKGSVVMGILIIGVCLWAGFYLPLAVLIIGWRLC